MSLMNPYVLKLSPILMPKVWGGRRLADWGKQLPSAGSAQAMIGESWELADLAATSASGGGGAAARSVVQNGPLAGKTLHDAMEAFGAAQMLGIVQPTPEGNFPLLVKYLDAREHLSVQVHPSIAYAKANPGANIKTECWYILSAEPVNGQPPVIFKGVKPGVTREKFEKSIADGTVVECMVAVPAIAGECHNLPSGTVHALGAGVLVAEVQTPSDTTFRVYDWAKEYGRTGRELHVAQSLACIAFEQAREATRRGPSEKRCRHVTTGYFELDELAIEIGERAALWPEDESGPRPVVVMCVAGRVCIADVWIAKGETALVPAGLARTVLEADQSALALVARVR
jgi:mannose-6-phosphate isomerase